VVNLPVEAAQASHFRSGLRPERRWAARAREAGPASSVRRGGESRTSPR